MFIAILTLHKDPQRIRVLFLNPYWTLHADIKQPELSSRMRFVIDFVGRKEKQFSLWNSLKQPVKSILRVQLVATK